MHHENIPGGGFAVNEITVWIFSENKDTPRIFSVFSSDVENILRQHFEKYMS